VQITEFVIQRAKTACMYQIFLEVTGWLMPLGLLAANFCFWAWIWDKGAGPTAGAHIPLGK